MGKRLLASFLAVAMMLTMAPFAFAIENTEDTIDANQIPATEEDVAGENQIETKDTSTLQSDIDAATGTYTLAADTTADITISKDLVLDLGGKTLKNTNSGKATISVTNGATVTVKNGTVMGGTSYYNIEVKSGGTLTLENVTATAGNTGSSMIDNWGTLTINSGTYTGGMNTLKNEPGSVATVNGGKLELNEQTTANGAYNAVILNYGNTTLNDGEFLQSVTTGQWKNTCVVVNRQEGDQVPSLAVYGGTFTNSHSSTNYKIFHYYGQAPSSSIKVYGGTFNKPVSTYLADGYVIVSHQCVKAATGVTLNQQTAEMFVGDTLQLTATIEPSDAYQAVTWRSSITANASLSNNGTVSTVTAKKAGTSTITVTTKAGNKKATCVVTVKEAVAEINGQKYASLQEAFDAAQSGETVTLVKDIDLSKTAVVSDKSITLDMNGKKLYNTGDIWAGNDWSLVSVRGTGDLTITGNGTLQAKENDCYAADVQDGATLTVENGKLVGNIHAVYVTEGTANIKGGTYSVQQKYPKAGLEDEFVLNLLDSARRDGTAKMIVTGGTFVKFNPANCQAEGANTNFCAPGYKTELTNGVYVVKAGTNDAMTKVNEAIADSTNEKIEEAIKAVTEIPNETLASSSTTMDKLNELGSKLTTGDDAKVVVKGEGQIESVDAAAALSKDMTADANEKQTITVTATEQTGDDANAAASTALALVKGSTNETPTQVLDIKMTRQVGNGEAQEIQPNVPVPVTITMPEGWKNAQIVYVEGNKTELVKTTVSNGSISATFNHFSTYVLVEKSATDNPNSYELILTPNTNDVSAGDKITYTVSLYHEDGNDADDVSGLVFNVAENTGLVLDEGNSKGENGVTFGKRTDNGLYEFNFVKGTQLNLKSSMTIGTLVYTVQDYGNDCDNVEVKAVDGSAYVTNSGYGSKLAALSLDNGDVTYHEIQLTFTPAEGDASVYYARYDQTGLYKSISDMIAGTKVNEAPTVTDPQNTAYRLDDLNWHAKNAMDQIYDLATTTNITSMEYVTKKVDIVKVTLPKSGVTIDQSKTNVVKRGEDSYIDKGEDLVFDVSTDPGAGNENIVKVKIGSDSSSWTVIQPGADGKYEVPGTTISGDVEISVTQELALTADDIRIFEATTDSGISEGYQPFSTYSGDRTLVLIKGATGANYVLDQKQPEIFKLSNSEYGTAWTHAVLVPAQSTVSEQAMLDYLKSVGLQTTNIENKVITYNWETAGVTTPKFVNVTTTYDFKSLIADKFKWEPTDEQLLRADVMNLTSGGNAYSSDSYQVARDGYVSDADVNAFMFLYAGLVGAN